MTSDDQVEPLCPLLSKTITYREGFKRVPLTEEEARARWPDLDDETFEELKVEYEDHHGEWPPHQAVEVKHQELVRQPCVGPECSLWNGVRCSLYRPAPKGAQGVGR